jgi:long-chain acyl-CoA synthetase
MTLVEMLKRNAQLFPEKTALIFKDTEISYELLYKRSNALANNLLNMGLKKGERIGLLMQKTPEVIISFLGATIAGGVVFPIDDNQTLSHIQFLLNLTNPSVLFVSDNLQSRLSELNIPCSDNKIIVVGQKTKKQYLAWDDVIISRNQRIQDVNISENDIAYLNLTSGTTGVPKCAVTTHRNIFWNTKSAVESLGLTHEDIHLCMFPVFAHPHELFARSLFLGGTIVLIDKISPKFIAKAISENKVTCMMAIASIYETLVRLHESSPFDIHPLRIPESGGMHVNRALRQQFIERFGIPIISVWGSTETTGIAIATPPNGKSKLGSMGKQCPYYEMEVVGENGEELPYNEIGEMIIKGPGVCGEYLGNSIDTSSYMKNGWFFTSDMVKKDDEGYFYFAGRKTGMMKVAGMKVFPTEIEDVLSLHPKIAEVAVVRENSNLHGEVPKAVIVPKEGVEFDKKEIRIYCEQRLSKYKIPRVIEFKKEIPKSPGGKILWQKL